MDIILELKRGTEEKILSENLRVGELALALDTSTIYSYDGTSKIAIGKALIDITENLTT